MTSPSHPVGAARRRAAVAGVAAAGLLSLWALPATAGAQSSAATQQVVDLAARGFGGKSALLGLSSFRLKARGETFIFDEAFRPGNTVIPASNPFTVSLDYDLRLHGDRIRADSVRTSVGTARRVREVISARRGYISGIDSNGGTAATTAMFSDRWAAVTREQRVLNPHLIMRNVLRGVRSATTAPNRNVNGRPHRVLVVGNDDVAPVRLYIDPRTGRLDRLTTEDHNFNRGDVRMVVDYANWRGTGLRFPRRVTIKEDGEVLHTETRTSVTVNPRIPASRFAFPSSVKPRFDRTLARRGNRTTEWLMSFAHLGFPKDGPNTAIQPREVAPGTTLIQGIGNNSTIIEQQDGIVVVEGPLNNYRADALIRYIRQRFGSKPIRYIAASHHHADHNGGMRNFVAVGARPVVHVSAVPFFRGVFARRDDRLIRDRLDRSTRQASFLPVPATGSVTMADPVRPVIALAEPTTHATSTILVFVPREGVLVVNGDTYTPGAPVGPGARSLNQTIQANGLNVKWIVGGHGGVISYADFTAALAAAPAS